MNTRTEQDFERLSAYIDGELAPAEKAELEARLAHEPELQAGLDDLRRTVRALRALPAVKPPRSFTLTPEQAGVRARRGGLFPALRLAAALCTLLLAVTVARDFVTSGGAAASPVSDAAVQSAGATSQATTEQALPNAAVIMTPTPETGVETMGAGAPAMTETQTDNYAATPLVHTNVLAPTETPSPKGVGLAPAALATGTETPTEAGVRLAEVSPTPPEVAAPSPAQPPAAPALAGLRLAEIVLAALALGLAVAAWLTRRG